MGACGPRQAAPGRAPSLVSFRLAIAAPHDCGAHCRAANGSEADARGEAPVSVGAPILGNDWAGSFMAKLLVAEDDPDAGLLMQYVLKRGGHCIRLVSGGQAVLDACSEEVPDLILLDVTMPDLDGYEVARVLKSRPDTQDVPIVFVTGSAEVHHKVAGLTLGANDYITKPFHRDELLARVEVALRLKREADSLKSANARLAALSVTDGLTGVYNRRHLDQRVAEEVARSRRHGFPLSCLMVDVDHFKAINDGYGHPVGDRLLRGVAAVLRQQTRAADIVGRYGGDEFMVVAPSTALLSALVVGERIRATVAQREVTVAGKPVQITVSIGVAQLAPNGDCESLVAAADRALLAAKAAGRNRVVADPPE
jgi:two-component system cell cycle response regulator